MCEQPAVILMIEIKFEIIFHVIYSRNIVAFWLMAPIHDYHLLFLAIIGYYLNHWLFGIIWHDLIE